MAKKKFKINNPGYCPLCGTDDLQYGTATPDGEDLYYPWTCNDKKCKASGKEYYHLDFCSHLSVHDKNDNFVPSESEEDLVNEKDEN